MSSKCGRVVERGGSRVSCGFFNVRWLEIFWCSRVRARELAGLARTGDHGDLLQTNKPPLSPQHRVHPPTTTHSSPASTACRSSPRSPGLLDFRSRPPNSIVPACLVGGPDPEATLPGRLSLSLPRLRPSTPHTNVRPNSELVLFSPWAEQLLRPGIRKMGLRRPSYRQHARVGYCPLNLGPSCTSDSASDTARRVNIKLTSDLCGDASG